MRASWSFLNNIAFTPTWSAATNDHQLEGASDDDGWAELSNVGTLLTKNHPDFDSRTYGYNKLGDLISTLSLFDVVRQPPREGDPRGIYVREKRRGRKDSGASST